MVGGGATLVVVFIKSLGSINVGIGSLGLGLRWRAAEALGWRWPLSMNGGEVGSGKGTMDHDNNKNEHCGIVARR